MADFSLQDEVELLKSVFAAADESVDVLSTSPTAVVGVRLNVEGRRVDVTFELCDAYPDVLPEVRVSVDGLTRDRNCQLAESICSDARDVPLGQPLLLELCIRAKEVLEKKLSDELKVPEKCGGSETLSVYFSVTEIDHMRDRKNYLKTLSRWSKDLSVTGRVIFCNASRRIFLLLTTPGCDEDDVGGGDALKDFLVRLRTTNVDVDSSGRPCKERLATVLVPVTKLESGDNPFRDFSVSEIPDDKNRDLQHFFDQHGLGEVFSRFLNKL